MDYFTLIPGAYCVARFPRGVFKQLKLYRRGKRIHLPHAGGFVRIEAKFGDTWGTTHPDIAVLEIDCDRVVFGKYGEPVLP